MCSVPNGTNGLFVAMSDSELLYCTVAPSSLWGQYIDIGCDYCIPISHYVETGFWGTVRRDLYVLAYILGTFCDIDCMQGFVLYVIYFDGHC
jgi:hypothetical protein